MTCFTACHALWCCCFILTMVCRRLGEVSSRKAARLIPGVLTTAGHYLKIDVAIVAF